jgi:hypothetical protein
VPLRYLSDKSGLDVVSRPFSQNLGSVHPNASFDIPIPESDCNDSVGRDGTNILWGLSRWVDSPSESVLPAEDRFAAAVGGGGATNTIRIGDESDSTGPTKNRLISVG